MAAPTVSRDQGLTIGVLSKRTGVHIETIRYYERIGILPPPPRTLGGHRIYDVELAKRLGFVKRGRELGFSLDEIRALLRLVDGGNYTCAEVKDLTTVHRDDVREKIADLRKMERVLGNMIEQCTGDEVPQCPIIDELMD